jgi:hypothetical protein
MQNSTRPAAGEKQSRHLGNQHDWLHFWPGFGRGGRRKPDTGQRCKVKGSLKGQLDEFGVAEVHGNRTHTRPTFCVEILIC